jgi:hypothetical protein
MEQIILRLQKEGFYDTLRKQVLKEYLESEKGRTKVEYLEQLESAEQVR